MFSGKKRHCEGAKATVAICLEHSRMPHFKEITSQARNDAIYPVFFCPSTYDLSSKEI